MPVYVVNLLMITIIMLTILVAIEGDKYNAE